MGYPNFNLTTIQLPAPSSNMTKAEYKEAYGIDLDAVDVRSFKLVIYGNEKYPIDQIKEVEDGIEIYFNGRILSITDIVQTSDEVYDVANSKPIYYHPIYFAAQQSGVGVGLELQMMILNNSPTPFTKTTLLPYLKSLMDKGALINTLGYVLVEGVAKIVMLLTKSTQYNIYYIDDANHGTINLDTFLESYPTIGVTDGVNKIN